MYSSHKNIQLHLWKYLQLTHLLNNFACQLLNYIGLHKLYFLSVISLTNSAKFSSSSMWVLPLFIFKYLQNLLHENHKFIGRCNIYSDIHKNSTQNFGYNRSRSNRDFSHQPFPAMLFSKKVKHYIMAHVQRLKQNVPGFSCPVFAVCNFFFRLGLRPFLLYPKEVKQALPSQI